MKWIPIRILFYQAGIDGKVVDNGIATWTKIWNVLLLHSLTAYQRSMIADFSHVEFWMPGFRGLKRDLFLSDDGKYCGMCSTSTMGQARSMSHVGPDGTVCRSAAEVLKHPQRWYVTEKLFVPESVFNETERYIDEKVYENSGYDKKAILSFMWPWRFHDETTEICTEHVFDNVEYLMRAWSAFNTSRRAEATYAGAYNDLNEFLMNADNRIMSPIRTAIWMVQSGITVGPLVEMV